MSKLGVCVECGEWTDVNDQCCGAGAWSEGEVEHEEQDEQEAEGPKEGA